MPTFDRIAKKTSFIGLFIGALLWGLANVASAYAEDASFDCKQAALVDEKIICSDSLLSHADNVLNDTYDSLMESTGDRSRQASLRADQHNWLLLRNRECSVTRQTKLTDDNKSHFVDCFLAAYEERTADLETIKSHPDQAPSEISTPIRKPQLATDSKATVQDKRLTDPNIKIYGSPLFAWKSDGSLLILAKNAEGSANLVTWSPGTVTPAVVAINADPNDIQKICAHGSDVALIRKMSSDAEPMSTILSSSVISSLSSTPLSWVPLTPELQSDCHFDIHRQLASSLDGRSYIDLGARQDNDDRFVKLVKDGTAIPITPALRIDRRWSLNGYHIQSIDSFIVSNASDAPVTAELLRRWAKNDCMPYWQVNAATGATTRICIPYNSSIKGMPVPLVTKTGLFVGGGDGGLFEGTSAVQNPVISDMVEAPSLSPDQCKIAFAGPARTTGERHVELFDVCPALPPK